jgi:hypothetical protein
MFLYTQDTDLETVHVLLGMVLKMEVMCTLHKCRLASLTFFGLARFTVLRLGQAVHIQTTAVFRLGLPPCLDMPQAMNPWVKLAACIRGSKVFRLGLR